MRAYAQERIKKKNKPTSERLILLFNLEQASQCTKASCFQYHNTNKASNTNTTSTSSLKNIETALRSLGDAAGLHSDFVSWVMPSVLFGNWHWALLTPASGLICSLAYSMNGFKKKKNHPFHLQKHEAYFTTIVVSNSINFKVLIWKFKFPSSI